MSSRNLSRSRARSRAFNSELREYTFALLYLSSSNDVPKHAYELMVDGRESNRVKQLY